MTVIVSNSGVYDSGMYDSVDLLKLTVADLKKKHVTVEHGKMHSILRTASC